MTTKFKIKKEDVLDKAKDIIQGDRNLRYGDPKINFQRIIKGWELILGHEITPDQYGMMMLWMKMARLQEDPRHIDSWIDIAGYAACTAEVMNVDS